MAHDPLTDPALSKGVGAAPFDGPFALGSWSTDADWSQAADRLYALPSAAVTAQVDHLVGQLGDGVGHDEDLNLQLVDGVLDWDALDLRHRRAATRRSTQDLPDAGLDLRGALELSHETSSAVAARVLDTPDASPATVGGTTDSGSPSAGPVAGGNADPADAPAPAGSSAPTEGAGDDR